MKKVTECPDCGGIVSASATTCPHCGAKRKPRTKLSTWIIGGLFMTGIIMVVGGKDGNTSSSKSNLAPDTATKLCAALKRSGATTCDIDFNLGGPNYIDATIPTSTIQARKMCDGIVSMVKADNDGFRHSGSPWEMRIFTPSSTRPVAACRLN